MNVRRRRLNRRSFLRTVAGGLAGAGPLAAIAGKASAFQGDNDSGPNSDPLGARRGSDSDPVDAAGRGRPPRRGSSCSDSDSGTSADVAGNGRRCGGSGAPAGCSDSDSSPNGDPAGNGRRCGPAYSGVTDADSSDSAGHGRRRNCSDADSGANADPAGNGRQC